MKKAYRLFWGAAATGALLIGLTYPGVASKTSEIIKTTATFVTGTITTLASTAATITTLVSTTATIGTLTVTSALTMPDGTITSAKMADSSIAVAQIADQAVTSAKLLLSGLPVGYIPCVTTAKTLGYCTELSASTGVCAVCN